MTHDELLEYVDFLPLDGLMAWMQPALRKVVELHKPVENTYYAVKKLKACEECVTAYPCSTIEVIEAVLND